MDYKRQKQVESRRCDLIAAAKKIFTTKGVTQTTVSDIVKAAGVAQGTFYLYFSTKPDIINAVVEQMVDEMVILIEQTVTTSTGAVNKFIAFRDAILSIANDPGSQELAEIFHRPENAIVHERMTERMLPRLIPLVENIITLGVSEGVFNVNNIHTAAGFVLGGLHGIEMTVSEYSDIGQAVVAATDFALRSLGFDQEINV